VTTWKTIDRTGRPGAKPRRLHKGRCLHLDQGQTLRAPTGDERSLPTCATCANPTTDPTNPDSRWYDLA
jgi:hypothetical protein